MISYSTPYTIQSGNISTNNKYVVENESVYTYTYNVGYYDDTKIKQRISLLETEVTDLQQQDVNFQYRLSLLESHENNWATKNELHGLENRVTKLEVIPVGLTSKQMDDILSD